MFDASLSGADIVLSLCTGAIVGLVIALALRFPRGWIGFAIALLLNLLSPWIMTTVWIVSLNNIPKVVGSPFLMAMLGVMNLAFICRLFKSPNPKAQPAY